MKRKVILTQTQTQTQTIVCFKMPKKKDLKDSLTIKTTDLKVSENLIIFTVG